MAEYAVTVYAPEGVHLATLDSFLSLGYVRNIAEIGTLVLGLESDFDKSLLRKHGRIAVWRQPEGGPLELDTETCWLITGQKMALESSGLRSLQVYARSANWLLASRIVAYAAESAQAKKTDQVDDMMKAIVRENLGALATDTDRNLAAWLNIDADLGLGLTVDKAFSRRNVLDVLRELYEMSVEQNHPVYFDIIMDGLSALRFKTFNLLRGVDHSIATGTNPVLISAEAGSLAQASFEQDWSDEVTVAYAAGQGEAALRQVEEREDTVRSGESVFARRESLKEATQVTFGDAAALQDEADTLLREGRPRRMFRGQIMDMDGCKYGVHWRFGDLVTAEYESERYDCLVRSVQVTVQDGRDSVTASLEANL